MAYGTYTLQFTEQLLVIFARFNHEKKSRGRCIDPSILAHSIDCATRRHHTQYIRLALCMEHCHCHCSPPQIHAVRCLFSQKYHERILTRLATNHTENHNNNHSEICKRERESGGALGRRSTHNGRMGQTQFEWWKCDTLGYGCRAIYEGNNP